MHRSTRPFRFVAPAIALFALAALPVLADRPRYPETPRGEVVETLHGVEVADPYRWLEQDPREAGQVARWIDAQNEVTFAFLEGIPAREPLRQRLTELWDYERYASPQKIAGRYYVYAKNDGLQNHYVYWVQDTLEGAPRVLLDPNTWSEDGTIALAGTSFSPDGRYVAYSRSSGGSDWQEWFVRDVAAGEDLPDRLQWTKFTDAAWTADGQGFFYSRFPEPPPGETYQALNTNQKVYYHRVGTPQSEDVLVYWRPEQPEWGYGTTTTEDGRWLVISVWKGTDPRNRVLVKDLAEPYGLPVEIVDHFDHDFSFVGNDGPLFYFKTDHDAKNRRVIRMDLRRPAPEHWVEIVPEREEPLGGVGLVGNLLIASYLRDATDWVRLYRLDGTHVRDVEFPGFGNAYGFGGRQSDLETFYSYSSFNRPPGVYRYDLLTGESTLWRQADVDFDPERYVVQQVFYRSKDGTRVPMFIAHRKDLRLDGKRPTLLHGYGGFNVSLQPSFSVTRLAWMELGGVFAMPNLRGGGEYGNAWHEAGIKLHKQNVFDDFIAAAEWLVAADYTSPEKLAIQGGSNGGLLVGAVMTQRPELFGAALPAVGVMDMLRFHRFTAGRYWVDDYGSPDDAQEFGALFAYSPYHNLRPGVSYPATLVTTADFDDRVIPMHSFKFAAALQHAQQGPEPVLIRIETRAGHGAGKPTAKQIEEWADVFAFLVETLSIELPRELVHGKAGSAASGGSQ